MRILFLNQYYPPDTAPTGRILHDVARELAARGHDVHVVSSRRTYDAGQILPRQDSRDDVLVHRVSAFGLGRRRTFSRLADYASFVTLALAQAARLPRPDLIVSLTTPPYLGLAATALGRFRRAPVAHWVMDVYPDALVAHGLVSPDGWPARALRRLARWQFARSRLVLGLGPFMMDRLAPMMGDSVRAAWVAPWPDEGLTPWPAAETNPLRAQRGWADGELVLLYSGNMGLGHRFDEFLEAARRLGKAGPRWAFIGSGPQRAKVEAFAAAHREARIELHPSAPPPELRASLCAADVHLVSLRAAWQGLIVPSKLPAAFAVGRPVLFLGPRQNEIARSVEQAGGGWVVAENDVDGLIEAVQSAASTSERSRRGAAARTFAEVQLDRRTNLIRVADLLQEAAERRSPRRASAVP